QPVWSGACAHLAPLRLACGWLPGSGPALRRSLPLGARRTLRVPVTLVKSFLESGPAPWWRPPNLSQPSVRRSCSRLRNAQVRVGRHAMSRIEAEAEPVKQAQPDVALARVPVRPRDRRARGLDHTGPQRLGREEQRPGP